VTARTDWSVIEPDSGFRFLHRFLGEQIARLGGTVTEGERRAGESSRVSATSSPSVTVLADYRARRES